MCGVLGFASTEQFQTRNLKQRFFTTGYPMIAVDRGMESSGLALVDVDVDANPVLYKKALCGWDFIQQYQVQKYLNDIEKFQVALGHVRASTRGNISDHNAHPFQYEHITLVHNGHIRNAGSLKDANKAMCNVDSAMVAYSMAHNGEMETLQEVEGGYVFIWWNAKTQRLNIARNIERPLFLAYLKKENSMYWASEMTHLMHLLRHADIDEDIGPLYPGAMTWYRYDLKDLRSPEKVPFVKSQGRLITHSPRLVGPPGNNNPTVTGETDPYAGWTDQELEAWAMYGTQTIANSITKGTDRKSRTTSDHEEIDAIRQSLHDQRAQDAKQSGIPTSRKRINRAQHELKKLGLEFKQIAVCYAISWHRYKNQREYGSMMCRMRKGNHLVEVINVRDIDFARYLEAVIVLVDCQNVRRGSDGNVRVVGTMSPKMYGRLENLKRLKEKEAQQEQNPEVDTEGTMAALGSIERDYDGPGGQKVTRARFLELVTEGCANCRRTIEAPEHGTVMWVGSPASPVCRDCNGNEAIMESLGFPEHLKALVH